MRKSSRKLPISCQATNDPVNTAKTGDGGGDVAPKPGKKATEMRDLYNALRDHLVALGDDVQEKKLKYYVAFKRLKNFACVEVHPNKGTVLTGSLVA